MKKLKETKVEELPIGSVIKAVLFSIPKSKRLELIEESTVDEFVRHRVKIFYKEFHLAIKAGFGEMGAEEIATEASIGGLKPNQYR